MKMTLHIDDDLLDRVVKAYGWETKTEAIHNSLKEMDRLARLREFGRNGLGLTKAEMTSAYADDNDPDWGFVRAVASAPSLSLVADAPSSSKGGTEPAKSITYKSVIPKRRKK